MASTTLFPRLILHSGSAAAMTAAFLALFPTQLSFANQYGGLSQFLTIHGLLMAVLAMLFSVLADLFPRATSFKHIKRAILLVAMPVAAVVSSIYWTLIIFFPKLIIPGDASAENTEPTSMENSPFEVFRIPLHVDLGMHALPGVALVLDFMIFEKRYSDKTARRYALPVAVLATVLYTSWAEHCAKINGTFPYPFLNTSFEVRLAIYAGATGIAYGSFRILNALHS